MNEKELQFILNPVDIITLITKYRKQRGITLKELAKLTNTSKSTLSRIEIRETEKIDYALVIKLKQALNIPDEEMLRSMNYKEEEKTKQDMELVEVENTKSNISKRFTYDNNIINPVDIITLITKYRKQRGITLKQLGELTNTNKSTLSRIETGETEKIDYALVIKLKQVLNIPDEEILMSMNYKEEEKTKQNMEIIEVESEIARCNVCGRSTYDRNIKLEVGNIKELKLGHRNQYQCVRLCKTCRENLRDLLNMDLLK